MFEQTKLNTLFKSKKQNFNPLDNGKASFKRKAETSIEEESYLKLKSDSTKRIKLDCSKDEDLGLGSKTTNCSSSTPSPSSQLELSSKTKGILDKLLLKQNKAHINDTKRKSALPSNQSILSYLQEKPKEKDARFSVESSEAMKKPLPLSDKAKEIILKLKQDKIERMNRFLRQPLKDNTRSDSSFSLKFKYEELLKAKRELLLPVHYKNIYNSFIALDQSINLFKVPSCEKTPTFQLLKETIEQSTYRTFDLKIMKQILYICPHLFIYFYHKANERSRYEMIIDIPNDHDDRLNRKDFGKDFDFSSIQTPKEFKAIMSPLSIRDIIKRKDLFRNILLELVNKKHEEFLKDKKHPYFNPFTVKTWHHDFDLASCDEIPEFQIQSAPDDTTNQLYSFERAIKNNDIKERLVSEALESISKTDLNDKDKLSKGNDDNIQRLREFVSDSFIQRLKAKEAAIKLSQEILHHSSMNNALKEKQMILNEILLQMKSLFIVNSHTKGSYELSNLVEILYHSSAVLKKSSSKDTIRSIVVQVSKQHPELISVKWHSSLGAIVIMNTRIDIPSDITIE